MEVPMRNALMLLVLVSSVVPAGAQTLIPPPLPKSVNLSGPRFGMTALPDGIVHKLHTREIDVEPTITQFCWQFERQFYSKTSGVAAVNEWVVLVGGLDQGVTLPSVS